MNIFHFKDLLLKEQERLVESMSMIGVMNNDIKGDWIVSPGESTETEPDLIADKIEEMQTNDGILDTLEVRMKEVENALAKIENGTYGVCEKCGQQIEEKRLEANPAATLCLECVV